MKTRTRTNVIVLVIISVLLIAAVAQAAPVQERPIKENLSGYLIGMELTPVVPGNDTFDVRASQPSQWISTSAGSGLMGHVGRVSWTTEHCFQLFEGPFGDAELVITAANGNRLFGTYDGIMTSETTFAETMIITGGTGASPERPARAKRPGGSTPSLGT